MLTESPTFLLVHVPVHVPVHAAVRQAGEGADGVLATACCPCAARMLYLLVVMKPGLQRLRSFEGASGWKPPHAQLSITAAFLQRSRLLEELRSTLTCRFHSLRWKCVTFVRSIVFALRNSPNNFLKGAFWKMLEIGDSLN